MVVGGSLLLGSPSDHVNLYPPLLTMAMQLVHIVAWSPDLLRWPSALGRSPQICSTQLAPLSIRLLAILSIALVLHPHYRPGSSSPRPSGVIPPAYSWFAPLSSFVSLLLVLLATAFSLPPYCRTPRFNHRSQLPTWPIPGLPRLIPGL